MKQERRKKCASGHSSHFRLANKKFILMERRSWIQEKCCRTSKSLPRKCRFCLHFAGKCRDSYLVIHCRNCLWGQGLLQMVWNIVFGSLWGWSRSSVSIKNNSRFALFNAACVWESGPALETESNVSLTTTPATKLLLSAFFPCRSVNDQDSTATYTQHLTLNKSQTGIWK